VPFCTEKGVGSKSEHAVVEKPFLGWTVIDQGPGVPNDPAKSLRTLEGVCRQSLNEINRTDQGQPWLTDKQSL
jgi:type I restriction enzyme R subunit